MFACRVAMCCRDCSKRAPLRCRVRPDPLRRLPRMLPRACACSGMAAEPPPLLLFLLLDQEDRAGRAMAKGRPAWRWHSVMVHNLGFRLKSKGSGYLQMLCLSLACSWCVQGALVDLACMQGLILFVSQPYVDTCMH